MKYKSAIDLRPGDVILTQHIRYTHDGDLARGSFRVLGTVERIEIVARRVKIYFTDHETPNSICLKLGIYQKVMIE